MNKAKQLAEVLKYQTQVDEDGTLIGVSRQAVDEVIELLNSYTHPVKQLSDEDIANIWAEHTKIAGTYDVKDIIFPFARAIIKEITE